MVVSIIILIILVSLIVGFEYREKQRQNKVLFYRAWHLEQCLISIYRDSTDEVQERISKILKGIVDI